MSGKTKRFGVDVEPAFHAEVLRYAKANRRSVQQLIRYTLFQYMRQNPIVEAPDGREYTET